MRLAFAAFCVSLIRPVAQLAVWDISRILDDNDTILFSVQVNVNVVLAGLGRNVVTGQSDPGEAW